MAMARVGQQPRRPDDRPQSDLFPLGVCIEDLLEAARGTAAFIAQTVAHAVTAEWWQTRVEMAGGSPDMLRIAPFDGPLLDLPPEVLTAAKALGRDIARLPIGHGCAQLGRIYTHALPGERRAAEGIYYTPLPLVSRLLDKAERAGHDWLTEAAIDPSSGGGSFLVEAAIRMAAAMPNADPAIVLAAVGARLRGWDIDPFACWLAQVVAEAALLGHVVASGKRLPRIVERRDALSEFENAKGRFGLAMGNPAFGKVKKTAEMGRKFSRSLYGHPNLYGMLTDVAVHLVKAKGGIVAYLTPTSYLGGKYFKALRRTLVKQARPVSVDIVESREDVFADVLQEVALTCLRRGRKERHAACSVIHVETGGLKITDTGGMVLPKNVDEPWILPRTPADAPLVAQLANMPARLRDWGYRVSTGPLVWNRHKARLHADPAPGRYPVIWAEAVMTDGTFSLQAAKSNHRDRAWFAPGNANDPNLVRRSCVLAQRTTAKEQHRRIICAVIPQQVIIEHKAVAVENHLNMFLPTSERPKVSLEDLAAFLSTEAADRVIRCINGSVALSASELEAMPLPSVDDLIEAAGEPGFESAVLRLYGIANEPAADSASRRHSRTPASRIPRGHAAA
jgi:adenine-specific DNA-methyltransferase